MMIRRHSHEAGDSWRKWTDHPAVLIERAWQARQRREFAVTVWIWALAIGAWAAIAAFLSGPR